MSVRGMDRCKSYSYKWRLRFEIPSNRKKKLAKKIEIHNTSKTIQENRDLKHSAMQKLTMINASKIRIIFQISHVF